MNILSANRLTGNADNTSALASSSVTGYARRLVAAVFLLLTPLVNAADAAEPGSAPLLAELSAEEIVEKADNIRFPAGGFQVDVKITTTRPEQEPEEREYRILSKGNDRTLLMTTAPAIDKGNILLMRDQDLWAFLRNLSQPVRLPLSAKLTGEVSNGDIARANFKGDYNPKLLDIETIEDQQYYKLELLAARRGVTYKRVLYWVNRDNFHPYKAEFYSVSNRIIKTCHYDGYVEMAGQSRPSRLVMVEASNREGTSILDYSNMAARDLPDKVFTKQYLKKLSN